MAAVAEGFLKPEHRGLLAAAETPEALLDQFARFQPPETPKWVELGPQSKRCRTGLCRRVDLGLSMCAPWPHYPPRPRKTLGVT